MTYIYINVDTEAEYCYSCGLRREMEWTGRNPDAMEEENPYLYHAMEADEDHSTCEDCGTVSIAEG